MKLSERINNNRGRYVVILSGGYMFALTFNISASLWLQGWGPLEGISFSMAVYIMALAFFL